MPDVRAAAVTALALALYATGLVAAFGLRSWLHRRRTGSTGVHGASGTWREAGWWGGVLFAVALALGLAAPVLDLAGTVPVVASWSWLRAVGLAVLALASLAVLAAQGGMGASWRIGVDEAERTELVTTGAFAAVRNPIFTAMVAVQLGLLLAVPSPVALLALAALVAAVELQVRCAEEPYLAAVHRDAYAAYARRAGRFLPGVGVLRSTDTTRR